MAPLLDRISSSKFRIDFFFETWTIFRVFNISSNYELIRAYVLHSLELPYLAGENILLRPYHQKWCLVKKAFQIVRNDWLEKNITKNFWDTIFPR